VQSGDKRYLLDQPSTGDACRLWAYPLCGRMRRLLSFLVSSMLSCSATQPNGLGIPASSLQADSVQYFAAYGGPVEECNDCVLFEMPDAKPRVAYFLERTPSCSLVRSDVTSVYESPFPDHYAVYVTLKASGRAKLATCAKRDSNIPGLPPSFLVVVDGEPLGVEFLDSESVEMGTIRFGEDALFKAVAEVLRPSQNSRSEP
jgi:hypothetical protein